MLKESRVPIPGNHQIVIPIFKVKQLCIFTSIRTPDNSFPFFYPALSPQGSQDNLIAFDPGKDIKKNIVMVGGKTEKD